jgi:hypothetical protein
MQAQSAASGGLRAAGEIATLAGKTAPWIDVNEMDDEVSVDGQPGEPAEQPRMLEVLATGDRVATARLRLRRLMPHSTVWPGLVAVAVEGRGTSAAASAAFARANPGDRLRDGAGIPRLRK